MVISENRIHRRTLLRGMGVVMSLPLLEAMTTGKAAAAGESRTRFVGIEMVHGAAGSTDYGRQRNYWSPAQRGADFEFPPTLRSLEPLRDYITIVSNTELKGATSWSAEEEGDGVDHARSAATFLTGAHPLRSASGAVAAGPSVDQLYARLAKASTRVPSLQLAVESKDVASGPDDQAWPAGYSAAYRQCISWYDAGTPLLPEQRLSAIFARLFGGGEGAAGRISVLDGVAEDSRRLRQALGTDDQRRLEAYFTEVRDVEKRIKAVESRKGDGQGQDPAGAIVPDSFSEHVKLLSDLQVLAFQADITRVSTLKLGMDRSQRVYPESGVQTPFHKLSHHREEPEKIDEYARLNAYHVEQVAYFLERLRNTPDGEDNLLHQTVVLYGSPMGDSHVHGHSNLPLFIAGHASGKIAGNRHIACDPGTPMANLLLTLARRMGVTVEQIGDSSGEIQI